MSSGSSESANNRKIAGTESLQLMLEQINKRHDTELTLGKSRHSQQVHGC